MDIGDLNDKVATRAKQEFGPDQGPLYKTNKMWFKVLKQLNWGASGVSLVFNNKILGAVTLVVDKALDVGEGMYKTLYIEYY